jgi:hypothetical protein
MVIAGSGRGQQVAVPCIRLDRREQVDLARLGAADSFDSVAVNARSTVASMPSFT